MTQRSHGRRKRRSPVIGALTVLLALAGCGDGPSAQVQSPSTLGGAGAPSVVGASGVAGGAAGMHTPTAGVSASAAGSSAGAGATSGAGAASGASTGAGSGAGTGAGSGAGTGGVSGMVAAGSGGMEAPPRPDLGMGDGSDVVTIGDSWMSLGRTGIQQSLVAVSGQPYRTYGRGGTRLLNEVIPGQYDTAKNADPDIKTVVMTGGGNDIIQVPGLRDDCDAGGAMCTMVVGQILDRLTALWAEMAADGVQDVIYVEYSNPEGNNVDFALPDGSDSAPMRCAKTPAPLRCHILETLDFVMGDIPDGIHPSAAGYDRVGKAVHDLMIERGMRR